jgi:hypothetical protein
LIIVAGIVLRIGGIVADDACGETNLLWIIVTLNIQK